MSSFNIWLRFHGDLQFFLKSSHEKGVVQRTLSEKSSVKDVIEACGVPHTEVDLILLNQRPINFSFQVTTSEQINVFPVGTAPTLLSEERLQLRHLLAFIADGHLGKLVRDLRLLGFDVIYDRTANDRQ